MSTGIIITAIICASVAVISIVPMVQDYKLKKEKIKADALVRAEEVKAKNQLEIEKLYISQSNKASVKPEDGNEIYGNPRVSKDRLRD